MHVIGDLGGQQVFGVLGEHARHIERDVAVADDRDGCRIQRPFPRNVGVSVEPADEVGRTVGADRVDPGNVEARVSDGSSGEDHRVVVVLEVVEGDVLTEADVAEQPDVAPVEHLAQSGDDALDARVVGRDAVADEAIGRRKLLEQVDRHVELALRFEQDVGGVDARRACTDDGQPELGHEGPFVSRNAALDDFSRACRVAAQLDRSATACAKRVSASRTAPSGRGSSASTASLDHAWARSRVAWVASCSRSSASSASRIAGSAPCGDARDAVVDARAEGERMRHPSAVRAPGTASSARRRAGRCRAPCRSRRGRRRGRSRRRAAGRRPRPSRRRPRAAARTPPVRSRR